MEYDGAAWEVVEGGGACTSECMFIDAPLANVTQIETTNFGSGGRREFIPGLGERQLQCEKHATVWRYQYNV